MVVNEVLGLKEKHGDELSELLERECGAKVVRMSDSRGTGEEGRFVVRESWLALKGGREERERMVEDVGEFLPSLLYILRI